MPKQKAADRLQRFSRAHWYEYLKKNLGIFFFFFRYLRPYKFKVGLIFVLTLLNGPLWIAGALITRFLIDEVVLNSYKPLEQRKQEFFIAIALQIGWWLVYMFQEEVLKRIVSWYLDLRVTIDLMRDFYDHEQQMDMGFHRDRAIGEHMYRTAEDVTDGDIGYQRGGLIGMITYDWMDIFNIIYSAVIAGLLFAFGYDYILGVAVLLYLIPKLTVVHRLNTWYKKIDYQNREIQQERFAVERDVVAGLKTIKALGRSRFAAHRFTQVMQYVQRMYIKIVMTRWLGQNLILNWFFKGLLLQRGVWIYTFVNIMLGRMTIGDFAVVTQVVGQMTKPFERLVALIQRFRLRLVPAERMYETMRLEPAVQQRHDALRLSALRGRVEFRDVVFGYDPDAPLLTGVNFTIEPGERVAFVGPSGAGKSTIFRLLLRLYDPQGGDVRVDGHSLRDLRLKSYLDRVGVILQETHLFSGTVAENIRYGDPLARTPKVLEAAEKAELSEYLSSSPDHLDTFLGEGTKISGGQKQRIGIARAIVRDPSMFIMDEPTAHLDVVAETNVMRTLERVSRGHTTLIIAHRLSTVLFVDRIIVLSQGGIEASGTHEELLQTSPTYRQLWQQQRGEGAS